MRVEPIIVIPSEFVVIVVAIMNAIPTPSKSMIVSAGLLLYRRSAAGVEVFLVHPGGPFFSRRDDGWWSVPKGVVGEDEDPLTAACREFAEETSFTPPAGAEYLDLGSVRQKGGKVVRAWGVEGDCESELLRSNTFTLEWPPRSGRRREFPEVDRAGFFELDAARRKILPAQAPFLDRLIERVGR